MIVDLGVPRSSRGSGTIKIKGLIILQPPTLKLKVKYEVEKHGSLENRISFFASVLSEAGWGLYLSPAVLQRRAAGGEGLSRKPGSCAEFSV